MRPPKPVLSKFYPRWIEDRDGGKRIVPNQQQHGAILLCEFDENAKPLYAPPPTVREAMAMGYPPEDALAFVKEEERKAKAFEWPYYPGAPAEKPVPIEPDPATPFDDPPQAVPVPPGTFADAETAARLTAAADRAMADLKASEDPQDIEIAKQLAAAGEPLIHLPVSEPLEIPELPHETELEPVGVAARPVTDEIEAMFAAKPKRRKKE
jgi:hypothetical protein